MFEAKVRDAKTKAAEVVIPIKDLCPCAYSALVDVIYDVSPSIFEASYYAYSSYLSGHKYREAVKYLDSDSYWCADNATRCSNDRYLTTHSTCL